MRVGQFELKYMIFGVLELTLVGDWKIAQTAVGGEIIEENFVLLKR